MTASLGDGVGRCDRARDAYITVTGSHRDGWTPVLMVKPEHERGERYERFMNGRATYRDLPTALNEADRWAQHEGVEVRRGDYPPPPEVTR